MAKWGKIVEFTRAADVVFNNVDHPFDPLWTNYIGIIIM